jgi:hypothetical protein
MRGGGFGRVVAATVIVTTAIIGANLTSSGGGVAVSANLFAVPPASSDGTTTCARSSTELEYAAAVSANAVCKSSGTQTSWEIACAAATGGDKVGVMPGVYASVGAQNWTFGNNITDCSDNTGADYDPNWREKGTSEGSLANWVTYVPGEDCGGTPNITFSTHFNVKAERHIIIGSPPGDTTSPGGECFYFNRTINTLNPPTPKNIIFRGKSPTQPMQVYGMNLSAPTNFLMENIDYGPNVQCAANDTNATPTFFRCDPSGPYFESVYATIGTNVAGCVPASTGGCAGYFSQGGDEFVEPQIRQGQSGVVHTNVRLDNFRVHDTSAKGTGAGVHPGCFLLPINSDTSVPNHNIVLNAVSCERNVIGVQQAFSSVTVQNSYFGCPVNDLAQTGGQWDVCSETYALGMACREDLAPGCVQTNVLLRYNVFFDGANPGIGFNDPASSSFGTYSNVRAIGNIFIGSGLTGCSFTGVTCANNSFINTSTAGSNPTTLSCDPTIDSDQSTPDNLWRESTQLDPRLSGASCGVPTLDPSTLGTDYQLGFDIDGDARGASATRAGVDN